MPWRWYLLSHMGNLLTFRDLSPIPADPSAPASSGPRYAALPVLHSAYNVLPLLHAPHPLTSSSSFFLALTAFSSASVLLSNPFLGKEKGRDALFNARGECKRERITAVVWVPRAMVKQGREERERAKAERDERREKERRREREKRDERERLGLKETDEQRRRRKKREEARRRRDDMEEEQHKREEAEEKEQADSLLLHHAQQQSSGRLGWDTFLVAYADGSLLTYDKLMDTEAAIPPPPAASNEYLRVVEQSVPNINPTCALTFGFPHTPPSAITSLSFNTSGTVLCVTQSNGVACLVDYQRRVLKAALSSHYGGWLCSAFTSDDALLLLGGEDDALTLVDTLTWSVVGRGEGHDAYVNSVYVRPSLERGVYRIVSAAEDGLILFWEWVTPRRTRPTPPPSASIALKPHPPLHALRRIHPVASNRAHRGPIAHLVGSHGVIARRREYRRVYRVDVDLMESQAEEGCEAGEEGEFIVSAGWDWTIKVWAPSAASGGAAAVDGKRGRKKRWSMRIVQPSPLMGGRVAEGGEVSMGGFSELSPDIATRTLLSSPFSLSHHDDSDNQIK